MEYSTEELIQCICECMAESLPNNWLNAKMKATVDGNNLSASFVFNSNDDETEKKFQPTNSIAPLNAAKFLQDKMASNGEVWKTITVRITSDGSYNLEFE